MSRQLLTKEVSLGDMLRMVQQNCIRSAPCVPLWKASVPQHSGRVHSPSLLPGVPIKLSASKFGFVFWFQLQLPALASGFKCHFQHLAFSFSIQLSAFSFRLQLSTSAFRFSCLHQLSALAFCFLLQPSACSLQPSTCCPQLAAYSFGLRLTA